MTFVTPGSSAAWLTTAPMACWYCGSVSVRPSGAANTMRGVQMGRPSLYAMRDELARCEPAVLVIAGDEDDGVLETDLMLKRTIPRCGLAVLPRSGHVTNLEEPVLFNGLVERFFAAVEHDKMPYPA